VKAEEKIRKRAELNERELMDLRANFSKLTLSNPNYFGNVAASKLKPELIISKDTMYEDIACVGFNPQQDILYAIIRVKLNYGYRGNLCSAGSQEYVRFYADWNGDGDFKDTDEDLGMASVNVHDIPGSKPLNYCVTLKLDPKKKPCTMPQKVKVRAILSWNAVPTPGDPDYDPVWGEVEDRWIQIEPAKFLVADLFQVAKVKLDPLLVKGLVLDKAIAEPVALTPVELKEIYKDVDVPEHRFNFKAIKSLAMKVSKNVNIAVPEFKATVGEISEAVKEGLVSAITSPADTKYEELHCLGLQYDVDVLSAVFTLKLSNGYSGSLCTKGSHEYIAFWADWDDDGVFEEYLGTSAVSVHDIPGIPEGGLHYAVSLPVNLSDKRCLCTKPNVVRIRAILSWEHLPTPTNPNYDPIWGNRVDALVQIKPGVPVGVGEQIPFISFVGDVAVSDIDGQGYATGHAIVSGFHAEDSPFGGWVTIAGHISYPPNISAGGTPLKYCVFYRRSGESDWTKITNKFWITISKWDGTSWSQYPHQQKVDSEGFYEYQEDLKVVIPSDLTQLFVEGFVMAKWYTGGLDDGQYEVMIRVKTAAGDEDSNIVQVRLDNTRPTSQITITEVEVDGTTNPATPCGTFPPGSVVKGKFTATDKHFWFYKLWIEPSSLSPNATVPSSEDYSTLPAPGATNKDWYLKTQGMKPCGYVAHLRVWDRTIVNSGYKGWRTTSTVGFCLTEKGPPGKAKK